tara:strand:- start:273 stop:542 length:270 start_codon:yes stop_codon:yes gene_type:complete
MTIEKTLTNLGNQKYIAEQKMELLEKMKKINELIFSAQENVIEIEEQGEDINDFEPFLANYPFQLSFHEIRTQWGDVEEADQIKEDFGG